MSDATDIIFDYRFDFPDGEKQSVTVRLRAEDLALRNVDISEAPAWTRIDNVGCVQCPLRAEGESHCPVAGALSDLVMRFDHRLSYEPVSLCVTSPERIYLRSVCSLQHAISSLAGIYMVSAGCPVFDPLRPMVRFHLPLASAQETIFRAVGTYLIAQYLRSARGLRADWNLEGLLAIYGAIHEANRRLSSAIMEWAEHDASANALVRLDLFASDVAWSVEDGLNDLAYLFQSSYLQGDAT